MSLTDIHELFQKLLIVDIRERQSVRAEIISLTQDFQTPDSLISYLDNDNYLVRETAATSLGNIKHENSVQALVTLLDKEDDNSVQMAIMYALRDIATETSLRELLRIATSPSYPELDQSLAIQSMSIVLMKIYFEPLFEILESAIASKNHAIVESVFDAFDILDQGKNSIPERLLDLLRSQTVPSHILLYIITFLGERRYAPAFETILLYLDSEDTDLQHCAIKALGNLGIPEAIARIEPKLNHIDDSIRYATGKALNQLQSAKSE